MKIIRFFIVLTFFINSLLSMEDSVDKGYQLAAGFYMRQGSRPYMEDTVTMLPKEEYGAFFGVFDGHGGAKTSAYAGSHLHAILHEALRKDPSATIEQQFHKSFELLDKKLAEKEIHDDGSTALVGLVQNDRLHIAWAGDSRAILIRDGKIVMTTVDHKPENETKRIADAGGRVRARRILPGGFAISRALGNLASVAKKKNIMIVTPDVNALTIKPNDILLMATDGFFDDIANEIAREKVMNYLAKDTTELERLCVQDFSFTQETVSLGGDQRLRLIAQLLCNDAVKAYPGSQGISNNSCDNISVLLVAVKDTIKTKAAFVAPENVP